MIAMYDWNEITTQSDIDVLMNVYGGFHDSCIFSVNYFTGSFVDENGVMRNGAEQEKVLYLSLSSQSAKETLELHFSGVRAFGFVGWQEGCFCDISSCYLKYDCEKGLFIWADSEDFSPESSVNPMNPECSYIIASNLEWALR